MTAGCSSGASGVATPIGDDALDARKNGDRDRHDELVTDRVLELAADVDVVVLAQASMSHLQPELSEQTNVPVLSSPHMAMEVVASRVETTA